MALGDTPKREQDAGCRTTRMKCVQEAGEAGVSRGANLQAHLFSSAASICVNSDLPTRCCVPEQLVPEQLPLPFKLKKT